MQTQLSPEYRARADGLEAESILRKCVHCGFCTATCPTYQLLGDELDGPRGRIYLIKQLLEGAEVTEKTQRHLDRCLTCRSCETTCPSGVEYHRLVDIGRAVVAQRVARPAGTRFLRKVISHLQIDVVRRHQLLACPALINDFGKFIRDVEAPAVSPAILEPVGQLRCGVRIQDIYVKFALM